MPAVPVVKNDGTMRLCGDFKTTLNPILQMNDFPIPGIDIILSNIGNSAFCSKIDIC